MVVLPEDSLISKEELKSSVRVTIGFLVPSLDQGPSPTIAQFGRTASSRNRLGGSKLLPFKKDGGHSVPSDLQCCRHFLVPFPRSVHRHNPVSELY